MSPTNRRYLLLDAIGVLLTEVLLAACNRPAPTVSPTAILVESPTAMLAESPTAMLAESPTATPAQAAQMEMPARVRREFDVVWAGPGGSAPISLPRLQDYEWHDLPAGGLVSTDSNGEGWVRIGDCMQIYVFQDSRLVKSACPKSTFLRGNAFCAITGTGAFNDQCASQFLVQTSSAQLAPGGTWSSVTYLPDRQLTLILVFQDQVKAQPVLDADAYTLGEAVDVAPWYFWFTTPGVTADPIAGLTAREPHPFDELLPLVVELNLWRWIDRITQRADRDSIPYPRIPPFVLRPILTPVPRIPTAISQLTPVPSIIPTIGPTIPPTVSPTEMPCTPNPPANWVSYEVKANDTLYSLATKTGTSVEQVKQVNCLVGDEIYPEQILFLPSLPPPEADLRIEKTASADPVSPGELYRYTVTVFNDGPDAAQNVKVIDTLPAGATFISGVGCTSDSAGAVVTCELGTVAAPEATPVVRSFTIDVKAPDAVSNMTITDNARVTSSTDDPDPNNNATSVSTLVRPKADLGIDMAGPADPVSPGELFRYTVTVSNTVGSNAAQKVEVSITLPAGATFVSGVGCISDSAGAVVTCELGSVAAPEATPVVRSFTIDVKAPNAVTSMTITSKASVTSIITYDPNPGNNVTSVPTLIIPRPDLTISKDNGMARAVQGTRMTYTIVVTNNGPTAVMGATVIDNFPPALTNTHWTCAASPGAHCPAGGSGNIYDRVDIPVSRSVTYTVDVGILPGATGSLVNTACVTAPDGVIDSVPTNNCAADRDCIAFQGCRPTDVPIMNTALWIAQILLAIVFLMAGVMQLKSPRLKTKQFSGGPNRPPETMGMLGALGGGNEGLISVLEILGAVGLVLPSLTCILTWLSPLAAAGLALLMVSNIITQVRRRSQYLEPPTIIVMNVVLLALAVFVAVAYGHFLLVSC